MADLDFKVIGLKIKQRRQELGITQEYIANALDVNPSHTFEINKNREKTLDDKIIDKIKYCDTDKKTRILKMIDLL